MVGAFVCMYVYLRLYLFAIVISVVGCRGPFVHIYDFHFHFACRHVIGFDFGIYQQHQVKCGCQPPLSISLVLSHPAPICLCAQNENILNKYLSNEHQSESVCHFE